MLSVERPTSTTQIRPRRTNLVRRLSERLNSKRKNFLLLKKSNSSTTSKSSSSSDLSTTSSSDPSENSASIASPPSSPARQAMLKEIVDTFPDAAPFVFEDDEQESIITLKKTKKRVTIQEPAKEALAPITTSDSTSFMQVFLVVFVLCALAGAVFVVANNDEMPTFDVPSFEMPEMPEIPSMDVCVEKMSSLFAGSPPVEEVKSGFFKNLFNKN